jgi:hypothetical protein
MVYDPFMKRGSMGTVQEDSPMSAPVVVARDWVDPNTTP